MKQFCNPHAHLMSLDSASTPEAFIKREVELGTGSISVTDHGSLAAIYRTYDLGKKNNLIVCPGLEFYERTDDCPILTKYGIPRTNTVPRGADKDEWAITHPNGSFIDYQKYRHGTLGFRDFKAYKLGVKLLSKAHGRAERHGSELKPLFTWNDIEELAAANTTLGSSCLVGMVARHLLNDNIDQTTKIAIATDYFERLLHLFGDRFYIEMFGHECRYEWEEAVYIEVEKQDGTKESLRYHFKKNIRTDIKDLTAAELASEFEKIKHSLLRSVCNYRVWTDFEEPLRIINVTKTEGFVQNSCSPYCPDGDMQFVANSFMLEMAKKYNVPVIPSSDAHFSLPSAKIVQDVRLAQQGSWRFYGSYHRQTSEEVFKHFNTKHGVSETEFEGWIENSYQWAEGFKDFKFDTTPQLPTKFFPKDTLAYTKELIKKHGRMPKDPIYRERLKKEIDILHKNGKIDLLPYFFTVEEVYRQYQNQGYLLSPGRGSCAGLSLAYLLDTTHVDPVRYDLSLERFINKARIDRNALPDQDSDLPSRDFLVGYTCDVIEVEAADGTKHVLPEDFKFETPDGRLVTAKEAIEQDLEIEAWWTYNQGLNK